MSWPLERALRLIEIDKRTETGENMLFNVDMSNADYDPVALRRYVNDGLPPWKGRPPRVRSLGHSKHKAVSRREAKRRAHGKR